MHPCLYIQLEKNPTQKFMIGEKATWQISSRQSVFVPFQLALLPPLLWTNKREFYASPREAIVFFLVFSSSRISLLRFPVVDGTPNQVWEPGHHGSTGGRRLCGQNFEHWQSKIAPTTYYFASWYWMYHHLLLYFQLSLMYFRSMMFLWGRGHETTKTALFVRTFSGRLVSEPERLLLDCRLIYPLDSSLFLRGRRFCLTTQTGPRIHIFPRRDVYEPERLPLGQRNLRRENRRWMHYRADSLRMSYANYA